MPRARPRTAQAYLEVAGNVLREPSRDEYLNVAAGLAVLAGIAASDAICGTPLGRIHRGDDHTGVQVVSSRNAADTTRWTSRLVDRACEETER